MHSHFQNLVSVNHVDCTMIKKKNPHIQYEEIQKGTVAKSYMNSSLLIYDYLHISSYISKPFHIQGASGIVARFGTQI
jgi:hypothetical protein